MIDFREVGQNDLVYFELKPSKSNMPFTLTFTINDETKITITDTKGIQIRSKQLKIPKQS